MSSPIATGGQFDEINLGGIQQQPPSPRRSPPPMLHHSNPPAFYSLTHGGFSSDDDESESEEEAAKKKAAFKLESAAQPSDGDLPPQQRAEELTAAATALPSLQLPSSVTRSESTVSTAPVSPTNQPNETTHDVSAADQPKQEPRTPPPQHSSPPPIYTTVCPPGIYPAVPGQVPCYAAPPHGHPPAPAAGATYFIDATTLNGMMPAMLIQAGRHHHHHCDGQSAAPPVFIISDPYAEWARRRRALAILTCTLFLFPMLFFLMILLSWSNSFN